MAFRWYSRRRNALVLLFKQADRDVRAWMVRWLSLIRAKFMHGRYVFMFLFKQSDRSVRTWMGIALFLTVFGSTVAVFGPMIFKVIVDNIAHPGRISWNWFMALLFVYALYHFLTRSLAAVRGYLTMRADRRMNRLLSVEWHSHIMSLPFKFHSDRKSGGVAEVLNNGLLGYQLVFQQIVMSGLPLLIQFTTMCFIMVKLDQAVLLGLFSATLIFYGLTFTYCITRIKKAGREATDAQVKASSIMMDSIINYVIVKLFTAEPVIRMRFDNALERSETAWERFARGSAWNGVAIGGIFATFLLATLCYAGHQAWIGNMSVGTFVMINAYIVQLVAPIESLGYAIQSVTQGFVYLEKMLEVFGETPEAHRADRRLPAQGAGELRFEDVSVGYRPDCSVLRSMTLTIPRGKTVALVGPSGGGKSTVVKLLSRFIDPDSGRILLDDVPIDELSLLKLRQSIAVVPQQNLLFDESIAHNIGVAKPGSTQAEIEQAARVACIHDFIMRQPEGYESQVGERGIKLSGGECQRISIARAVLKRPKLYVFDEATSSLDVESEATIVANIREYARDATTLIIAHRLSTVAHADQICVLSEGTIIEHGTHEELLLAQGRYASMIRKQVMFARAMKIANA